MTRPTPGGEGVGQAGYAKTKERTKDAYTDTTQEGLYARYRFSGAAIAVSLVVRGSFGFSAEGAPSTCISSAVPGTGGESSKTATRCGFRLEGPSTSVPWLRNLHQIQGNQNWRPHHARGHVQRHVEPVRSPLRQGVVMSDTTDWRRGRLLRRFPTPAAAYARTPPAARPRPAGSATTAPTTSVRASAFWASHPTASRRSPSSPVSTRSTSPCSRTPITPSQTPTAPGRRSACTGRNTGACGDHVHRRRRRTDRAA